MIAWYYDGRVTARKLLKEKIVSQYRTAGAFNEKTARLETQKQFLSSRIYAQHRSISIPPTGTVRICSVVQKNLRTPMFF